MFMYMYICAHICIVYMCASIYVSLPRLVSVLGVSWPRPILHAQYNSRYRLTMPSGFYNRWSVREHVPRTRSNDAVVSSGIMVIQDITRQHRTPDMHLTNINLNARTAPVATRGILERTCRDNSCCRCRGGIRTIANYNCAGFNDGGSKDVYIFFSIIFFLLTREAVGERDSILAGFGSGAPGRSLSSVFVVIMVLLYYRYIILWHYCTKAFVAKSGFS